MNHYCLYSEYEFPNLRSDRYILPDLQHARIYSDQGLIILRISDKAFP